LSEKAQSTEEADENRAKSSMCPSVSSPSIPEASQITSGAAMYCFRYSSIRPRSRCGLRFRFNRHCSVVSTRPLPLTSMEPPSMTMPGLK